MGIVVAHLRAPGKEALGHLVEGAFSVVVDVALVRRAEQERLRALQGNAASCERAVDPLDDPARAIGSEEQIMTVFRACRDEVRDRVQELVARLTRSPAAD